MYEGKIGHWIKHEDLRQGYGEIIKDIYWTCSVCGYRPCGWYLRENNKPYKAKVVFIGINGVDNFFNVQYESGNMWEFKFSDIGNTVFLNPHEAIVSDYKLKMEDK